MGREAEETARFAGRAGELRDALISVGRLRGVFDPLLDTLPSLGTLAVLLVGAWRLRQGAVNVTEVVSVAFLFTVLAFPVRAIGWVLAELPRSVAGWDRVQRVLDATGEMPYGDAHARPTAGAGRRCASTASTSRTTPRPAGSLHDVTLHRAGRADRGPGRPDRRRQVHHRLAGRPAGRPGQRHGHAWTAWTCAS